MRTPPTACRRAIGTALLLSAMAAPTLALAQQAPPPATPPATVDFAGPHVVTPAAQAVLDRMTAALKSHKRYAVTAQITRDELLLYGYKLQHNETAKMWVESPDHLRVELDGDIKTRT